MAPEYLIKKSPLRKINNYIDDNYDFFNFFNLEKGIESFDSQNNSFNLKEYDEFWYREKNQFVYSNLISRTNLTKLHL